MQNAIELLRTKMEAWGEAAVTMLPNLAVALLVFLAFWLLSKIVRRVVERGAIRVAERDNVIRLLATTAGFAILLLGLFVALGVLGLDKTVTSLLAGAGVLGLSLGFALQTLMTNYVAGTLISLRGTYKEGDLIEADGHYGKVEEVDLRVTRLLKPTGEVVLVPNKEIFENSFVNHSTIGERRVDVDCGVSYGDDLDKAKRVAVEAVSGIEVLVPDRAIDFFYTAFGGSSIDFRVRFWVPFKSKKSVHEARGEAIMRIKRAFEENDLSIPFPIRTLDFGTDGGESLAGVLARN